MIRLSKRIEPRKSALASTVQEDLIILDQEAGVYYGAGPVGAVIWQLISESPTVEEIRDHLLQEFDVDAETCENDLLSFLSDLHARNLIKIV